MSQSQERICDFTALLLIFLFLLIVDYSARTKSLTVDEYAHITAGAHLVSSGNNDLIPEAGYLSLAWPAIVVSKLGYPQPEEKGKSAGSFAKVADSYFANLGDELPSVLLMARRAVMWSACLLALVVYLWARKLHGPLGGLVSLTVFVFSPTVIAHSRLANTDILVSLFWLLSLWAMWRVLNRVTIVSVLFCGVIVGLALLVKFSTLLIAPLALLLIALRLSSPEPLLVGDSRSVSGWTTVGLLAASVFMAVLISVFVIWTVHGFDFSPNGDLSGDFGWSEKLSSLGWKAKWIRAFRENHLLPESWLYGLAYTLNSMVSRRAYLCGQYSTDGWWWYFPYSFLVKTPVATLLIMVLAIFAYREKKEVSSWLKPVVLFCLFYAVVLLVSSFNIGQRHALPLFSALAILVGKVHIWLQAARGKLRYILLSLLMVLVVESLSVFPHYISFFNLAIGGPAAGRHHLVDSSLDWGQDIERLVKVLRVKRKEGVVTPFYCALFGPRACSVLEVENTHLISLRPFQIAEARKRLKGGLYCISAHVLQSMTFNYGFWGKWDKRKEELYLSLKKQIERQSSSCNRVTLRRYATARLARLCSFLRHRKSDEHVGYSIYLYQIDEVELSKWLAEPKNLH